MKIMHFCSLQPKSQLATFTSCQLSWQWPDVRRTESGREISLLKRDRNHRYWWKQCDPNLFYTKSALPRTYLHQSSKIYVNKIVDQQRGLFEKWVAGKRGFKLVCVVDGQRTLLVTPSEERRCHISIASNGKDVNKNIVKQSPKYGVCTSYVGLMTLVCVCLELKFSFTQNNVKSSWAPFQRGVLVVLRGVSLTDPVAPSLLQSWQ